MARNETDTGRRLAMLLAAEDTAGEFLRRLFAAGLSYAATIAPRIADDAWSIDAAMRWGFGWSAGPLETIDALGTEGRERLRAETAALPERFYANGASLSFVTHGLVPIAQRPGALDLGAAGARAREAQLPSNAAASVVELPDSILGLELHAKLNIIGPDTLEMLTAPSRWPRERYDGLVIGTAATDFSAGANLALMLIEAEEGEWGELERAVRRFQEATTGPALRAGAGGRRAAGPDAGWRRRSSSWPRTARSRSPRRTSASSRPAWGSSRPVAARPRWRAGRRRRYPTECRRETCSAVPAVFTTIGMARVATSAVEARSCCS